MAVEAGVGFAVAPFLVRSLGDTVYGLWILIASLTSYFGMLDLGVRGSVGRFVAFHRAKQAQDALNRTLTTALAMLSVVGLVALAGTLGVLAVFFDVFDVPPEEVEAARWALILVGVNLAVTFPLKVFDATLWGFQRFDLLNLIDIPVALARGGLTVLLIRSGGGLVELALIVLACTAVSGAAKGVLSFVVERSLRVRPALFGWAALGDLVGYGIWNFVRALGQMTVQKLSPFVIGAALSLAAVTPFSIALRLVGYASLAMVAASGVLTPVATMFHAQESHARQHRLFFEGGKYCTSLSLYFLALFLLLGQPLIVLWMGPDYRGAWQLLWILALGEVLPMSQLVTESMMLGMARHQVLAGLRVAETILALVLGLTLVQAYGLTGMCVGLALPAAALRGAAVITYGCVLVGVGVHQYGWRVLLPALATAAVPAGLLAWAVHWHEPDTWPKLFTYGLTFTALYAMVALAVLGSPLRGVGTPIVGPLFSRSRRALDDSAER